MTEKSPCAAPATVEGLMALTRKWHFDVLHSDEDADATEKDIRAYAERLAALATPAGVDAVPVAPPADSIHSTSDCVAHGLPTPLPETSHLPRELMESHCATALESTFEGFAKSIMAPKADKFAERVYAMGFECGWRVRETYAAPARQDDREAERLPAGNEVRPQDQPESGVASPRPSTEGAEQEARKLALTDDEILAAFSDTAISEDAPKHKAKIDYMLAVGRTIERAAHQAQPCVMVADCDGPIRCTTCTDRKRCAAEGCVRLGGSAA